MPSDRAALLAAVAAVTGHPARLLVAEADLEADLGMRPATCAEALRRAGCGALDPRSCRTLGDLLALASGAPRAPADRPLAGRVALITGSGQGLGRVIVERLAALGAAVAVNTFHSREAGEKLVAGLTAAGHRAVHVWGSVANPAQLDDIFRTIEREFGVLDVFVNNASNGFLGPLHEATPTLWERGYRTNVIGLHQGAMLAAKLMTRGGHILAITSPGTTGTIENFAVQGTVKAAVESLLRYLAVELAPRDIQVNAVSAGGIEAPRLYTFPEAERLVPDWRSRTVEQRLVSEADVADLVVRLIREPVAASIPGARVVTDGGASVVMPGSRLG